MIASNWRFLLSGVAMCAAALAAIVLKPSPAGADASPDLEKIIPARFGEWTAQPTAGAIVPAPDVEANLARLYSQIVSRTYINPRGERIMLMVAYGGDQSDALKAHRQEVCYAAQGFQIRALSHGELPTMGKTIPVTRMHAVRGRRSEPVTYWFTMGDQVVLGRLERLVVQLRYGLAGWVPDGLLVRVSSFDSDPARAYGHHGEFLGALMQGVQRSDLPRLIGAPRT
jgi:EpsI family protein